jgi:hypothetical protein
MGITCCFCEPSLTPDYPWEIFMQDMRELLFVIGPLTTCVLLWRLFVTNRITPPGNVIVLGLDASDSHSALSSKEGLNPSPPE